MVALFKDGHGAVEPQLLKTEVRSGAFVFPQEVTVRYNDEHFFSLLSQTKERLIGVAQIRDLKEIVFSTRPVKNIAGTTIYPLSGNGSGSHIPRINFYSHVLECLSDLAVVGVFAHELAHAWLNENEGFETSKTRERKADDLARLWGFGSEINTLHREADVLYRGKPFVQRR